MVSIFSKSVTNHFPVEMLVGKHALKIFKMSAPHPPTLDTQMRIYMQPGARNHMHRRQQH